MKKNILANIIGRFWGILSNFLFIPLYIKFLGFESFSIISFSLVIAGLMAVLDAGLTATLSREFSRVDNSLNDKIRIFNTIETTFLIIIFISIVFVFGMSDFIAVHGVNLKTFSSQKLSYFVKIIAFDIGFQLLLRFYLGGLLGLEKQVKANVYQVFWGILRNGLVVLAIIYIPTLEMFFIWQSVSTILFAILFRLSLNQELTGNYSFKFNFKIEKEVFQKIWKFAGGMLLISIVAAFNTQLDKMAISKLLPVESLGYYTLAVSLATGIMIIVNPISIALLPRFTALYSIGNTSEATGLYNKTSLLVAILVFSIMANMSFFSKELLWIWTGDTSLSEKASVFLPIISFTFSMLSLATIPYNVAIANGYTKLNNILGLLSLFITLPGYWYATKNYGAIGAATVYSVVQTLITIIYIYFINKIYIGVSFKTVYFKNFIFPLVISLVLAGSFSFMPNFIINNRIFALIWIGLATFLTIITSLIIQLSKSDKIMVKNYFFKYKNRIA